MPLPPLSPSLAHQLSLPLDSSELSIPHFASLYRVLSNEILDRNDGATLAGTSRYQNKSTEAELKGWWLQSAKNGILVRLLEQACTHPADFSNESGTTRGLNEFDAQIREVGFTISKYISFYLGNATEITMQHTEVDELMKEDLDEFESKMDIFARQLSQGIIELEQTLQQMTLSMSSSLELNPGDHHNTNSTKTRKSKSTNKVTQIPSSSRTAISQRQHQPSVTKPSSEILNSHLESYNTTLRTTLPFLLADLTSTLHSLLRTQTNQLTTRITHLETYTHSTQSRSLTTQATFLATVSKGIALKTQILSLLREKETYAQQHISEALGAKKEDLTLEQADLVRRERELTSLLGEYGSFDGGEETFRTLGFEYGRIEEDIEQVKSDIERLEGQKIKGTYPRDNNRSK